MDCSIIPHQNKRPRPDEDDSSSAGGGGGGGGLRLTLVPLSQSLCASALNCQKHSPDGVEDRRKTLVLKLPPAGNGDGNGVSGSDVGSRIDVDVSSPHGTGASGGASALRTYRFQDGSIATVALMGRNSTTGIDHLYVSRALCDVSLGRPRREVGGGGTDTTVAGGDVPSGVSVSSPSSTAAVAPSTAAVVSIPHPLPLLQEASAWLNMRKAPGKHHVCLDGQEVTAPLGRSVTLRHGSILTLYGPIKFGYRIKIVHDDDEDNGDDEKGGSLKRMRNEDGDVDEECEDDRKMPAAKPPISPSSVVSRLPEGSSDSNGGDGNHDGRVAASSSAAKDEEGDPIARRLEEARKRLRPRASEMIVEECTCALCMEVLVRASLAHPCGHAFCGPCAGEVTRAGTAAAPPAAAVYARMLARNPEQAKAASPRPLARCPTCRGDVTGWTPGRALDAVIWATALQGSFDPDDAREYLQRRADYDGDGGIGVGGGGGVDRPTEEERACIFNGMEGASEREGATETATIGGVFGGGGRLGWSGVAASTTTAVSGMSRGSGIASLTTTAATALAGVASVPPVFSTYLHMSDDVAVVIPSAIGMARPSAVTSATAPGRTSHGVVDLAHGCTPDDAIFLD